MLTNALVPVAPGRPFPILFALKKTLHSTQSAPAATSRKEQEQIEAAIRKSLQDSEPSQPSSDALASAKDPSSQKLTFAGKDASKDTVVMDTPSTSGGTKPAVVNRRCLLKSFDISISFALEPHLTACWSPGHKADL